MYTNGYLVFFLLFNKIKISKKSDTKILAALLVVLDNFQFTISLTSVEDSTAM